MAIKVSIITATYNSQEFVSRCIESVLNQNIDFIEHIFIDCLSTDATLDTVRRFLDSYESRGWVLKIISEKDNGIYDAMNKGIKLATGDIVGILNSDDIFASDDSVANLVSGFDDSVDGVYSDLVYVKEQNLSKITRLYSSKIFKKNLIRFGIMLPHPTFYVRKSCYEKFGYYKTDYRVAADFELIARFISKNIKLNRINSVTVKMREGGISSSGLAWRVHQNFEIVKACRANNINTNIFLVMLKLPYKLATLLTRFVIKV